MKLLTGYLSSLVLPPTHAADSSRCLFLCRPTVNAQATYEKSVFAKTNRTIARSEGIGLATLPLRHCAQIQHEGACPVLKVITAFAAEITMFDEVVVVYKFIGDLMFFVTGSQDENELILYQVLQGFYEAVSLLLRYVTPNLRKCSTASYELVCGLRVLPLPQHLSRDHYSLPACRGHAN